MEIWKKLNTMEEFTQDDEESMDYDDGAYEKSPDDEADEESSSDGAYEKSPDDGAYKLSPPST